MRFHASSFVVSAIASGFTPFSRWSRQRAHGQWSRRSWYGMRLSWPSAHVTASARAAASGTTLLGTIIGGMRLLRYPAFQLREETCDARTRPRRRRPDPQALRPATRDRDAQGARVHHAVRAEDDRRRQGGDEPQPPGERALPAGALLLGDGRGLRAARAAAPGDVRGPLRRVALHLGQVRGAAPAAPRRGEP